MGRTFHRDSLSRGDTIYPQGSKVPLSLKILTKLFGHFQKKLLEELEIPERGRDLHDKIYITPEDIGGKIKYPARKKWGRSKDILIKIPQGIKNGQKIKLKGHGGNGKYGGEPGDLYLEVKIKHSLPQIIGDFIKNLLKRSG